MLGNSWTRYFPLSPVIFMQIISLDIRVMLVFGCRWSRTSSICKTKNLVPIRETMILSKEHGTNMWRISKKLLNQVNDHGHICRFLFFFFSMILISYILFSTRLCLVVFLRRDINLIFIFSVQAFIDKFRFNAKRASLVQSRIKVSTVTTIYLIIYVVGLSVVL